MLQARTNPLLRFDPTTLGVVGAWFDISQASNAGAGLAFTLPDRLSANHGTTTTDARKPTIGAASNGVPILTCSASALQVPLSAPINGATKWWFAAHLRITSAAGNPVPCSIDSAGGGGASTRKVFLQRFTGDNVIVHDASSPTTLARRAGPATAWTLNTWVNYIVECNLDRESSPGVPAAEADRVVVSLDGTPVVSTFADSTGTPGNMPAAMAQPTGFMNLFAQNAATGGNGWVGQVGGYILIGNGAMAAATRGCLTAEARTSLSNFMRPA